MKIVDVITSPGLTGFFADDQIAIRENAELDGFTYKGKPKTPGFTAIRQKGESVSVMLELEDGQVAYGDCVVVQYAGVGGRDPAFKGTELAKCIEGEWAEWLCGKTLNRFRPLTSEMEKLHIKSPAPVATRYGISMALLDAVAKAQNLTMAEVIAQEYGTRITDQPVPIFAQSGDQREYNIDKMILKRVGVLPHGLINNVERKVGRDGELFLDFVRWIVNRIQVLGDPDYRPRLHFDVYGTLGLAFMNDWDHLADYLGRVSVIASPYQVQIEGPMDAGCQDGQIEAMQTLRGLLRRKGVNVMIVADEWCNTIGDIKKFLDASAADFVQVKTPSLGSIHNSIEAILYAQQMGGRSYLGGSCNETERCGQVCAHIALATNPDQMLAKPGMGVDEGLMVVFNEMQRTLALIRRRSERGQGLENPR
jgi:methylaspartate ammonia-lyase